MGLLDDAIKEHLELKRRRGADAGEISRLESEALGPVRRSAAGVPDLSDTFEPPHEDEPDALEGESTAATSPPASLRSDDEATAAHTALPQTPAYEPPPAPPAPAYEPPPAPPAPAYEPPPISPPSATEPPPVASRPAYEPPPPPAYESPPVIPPPTREAWMDDELGSEPEPERHAEPEPEPEPTGGLFSRLRGGRRHKHDRDREPQPQPQPQPEPLPEPEHRAPYVPEGSEPQHEPDIVPADDEPDGEDLLEETPEFLEETPEHDRLWFEQRPPRDFNFDD